MPTPYTIQKDPNASNIKSGPQESSGDTKMRAAAIAGLGEVGKSMSNRGQEIDSATADLHGGESNVTAAHPIDLLAAPDTAYAKRISRKQRV